MRLDGIKWTYLCHWSWVHSIVLYEKDIKNLFILVSRLFFVSTAQKDLFFAFFLPIISIIMVIRWHHSMLTLCSFDIKKIFAWEWFTIELTTNERMKKRKAKKCATKIHWKQSEKDRCWRSWKKRQKRRICIKKKKIAHNITT